MQLTHLDEQLQKEEEEEQLFNKRHNSRQIPFVNKIKSKIQGMGILGGITE